jgi:hypothetical protein
MTAARLPLVARAEADTDLLLVERMLAPPPLDEARSSLEFWRSRYVRLPFYRRAARREAAEMAARWQERVRAGERVRFEATLLGRVLVTVGLSELWLRRHDLLGRGALRLAWRFVPARVKLAAVGTALLAMVVFALVLAAMVELLGQLG